MIIREELCVGCGRCQPFCPPAAIRYEGLKSAIDQDVCYECGACLRCAECPVDAIAESPDAFEYPRSVRGYFSDPISMHPSTGIAGRGTEESKSNDVTLRVGPGEVGIAIEMGRPTLGIALLELQKVTRALARTGIHKIEPSNPVHSMLANEETGDLKPELLGERVLSAIIEIKVERDQLRSVLRTLKEVTKEMDSVFCIDACTVLEPGLKIPDEVLESIQAEGFTWRPNAKINMGLGRA
jgi:NAD-dependent dihydropyrimidine dehydrogenase PreA subunit